MDEDQQSNSRSAWRHARTGIVMLALLGLVVWAGWQGYLAFTEPSNRGNGASAECVPADPDSPRTVPTDRVSVRVYNATLTAGLATRVGTQLSEQGFNVIEIANDPKQRSIGGEALIVSNGNVKARVRTLKQFVPEARGVKDGRNGKVLDLVLGESFVRLTIPPPVCPSETEDGADQTVNSAGLGIPR